MGSLNVDEANFKSERKVVEEERRLRVDNQPYGSIEEDLRAVAFTVHGYHHTPIGSIADLDKATLEDVRAFFNTYYKPNNATLVIVGDFDSDQALAWTRKYFDGIPASAGPIPRPNAPEPPQTAERDVAKSYSNTPLPAVVIGYKIPARYSPDSYPLDLASNILAGGESSRLYQALVYKDQIAVQAAGFGNFSEDPNLFWAYAIMNPSHKPEDGQKAVVAILDGLKTQPVGANELQKAKNQEISGFILGRDTDEAKSSRARRRCGDWQESGSRQHRSRTISDGHVRRHRARRKGIFRSAASHDFDDQARGAGSIGLKEKFESQEH